MAPPKEVPAEVPAWYAWYQAFDDTYSPATRKTWYSKAAKAYRWARPTYPDSLIDQAIQTAGLTAGSEVLEIGCGPGIATQPFAERGLTMQCVEPSAAACELARISCQGTDTVTVTNTTFEAFELGDRTFDAVLAATSFHWVSPDIACPKSAAALKPGGALILLWATPPQLDPALCAALQPVYDQHGLSELGQQQWRSQAYYQTNFEQFATTISQSGFFEPTQVTIQQQRSPYTLEKYLALLSTLSDYIALPASQQEQLMSDLSHALHQHIAQQDNGPDMQLTHWFGHQVSPKASP